MSISTVTSEALQLKLRQLLPSQQGFGTDLSASDTIIPIIDLTAAAEGSDVPEYLQRALDFSTGHTNVTGASSVIINNTGFWRVILNSYVIIEAPAVAEVKLTISDGLTTKSVWESNGFVGATARGGGQNADVIIFLRAGDSASISSNQTYASLDANYRQIADVNGNLVNPLGFNPQ
jgi:hypothetical protein